MLRVRVDQLICMAVVVLAVHPFVVRSRHHVPEMADDAVDEVTLAVLVEVESPRVRRAMTDRLDSLGPRMIAPDAAVDAWPFLVGRAGDAGLRLGDDAVTAV